MNGCSMNKFTYESQNTIPSVGGDWMQKFQLWSNKDK